MRRFLIISRFELVRLFFTRRGLLFLAGFGLVWYMVLRYPIYEAARFLDNSGLTRLIERMLGDTAVTQLLAWPVAELAVLWLIALFLFPLFSLLLAADQTASDRSRGTLRLINLRATRSNIYFGRFAGQMIIQTLLVLATVATTLLLALARDGSLLYQGLHLSGIIVVNVVITLLPFTALLALTSAVTKSARQATSYAIILLVLMVFLFGWLGDLFAALQPLKRMLLGAHLPALIGRQGWDTLEAAALPVAQAIILLLLGWLAMHKRSV